MLRQVSRPTGQPKAGDFSAGVSPTPSPLFVAFTHPPWLAVRDRAILAAVSSGSTRVYDATPLVIDKSVRALAMPVDNALLIYVEYAAPFGNKP